ncbi:Ketosteroid isomerase-related protein [Geodermatophilus africanus]|uniref:Ketosteroid isomerase-related protein n=1 Tax=Geodermatophilus africanus TaxID=1137993 RepID=A0A1H3QIQ6_9ACTN|nr:nuclear transport factor 2 family protein [Geodermatophilus africanus]SDZ13412.1 Ketosteroid isomerase-related protein [Geodermatophilus africanus]
MTTTAPSSSALDTNRALLAAADTDIAAFFALFTDDCRFRMANSEVICGRDAIQAWVARYLGSVAGMRHVILEEWAADDVAAVRVEVTYTMQNGTEFTLPAVTRTRVRDGKVAEYLIFMDPSPVRAASR